MVLIASPELDIFVSLFHHTTRCAVRGESAENPSTDRMDRISGRRMRRLLEYCNHVPRWLPRPVPGAGTPLERLMPLQQHSWHLSIHSQEQSLGAEDDLDVLVSERVFQRGNGHRPHLEKSRLGRFALFGGFVAKLRDECTARSCRRGSTPWMTRRRRPDKLLGWRKDIEQHRLVDRLAR